MLEEILKSPITRILILIGAIWIAWFVLSVIVFGIKQQKPLPPVPPAAYPAQ